MMLPALFCREALSHFHVRAGKTVGDGEKKGVFQDEWKKHSQGHTHTQDTHSQTLLTGTAKQLKTRRRN